MSAASITLNQALEDVEVRFLYNMPESELSKIDRLFFQIEQAWWFYEDFYADAPQNSHLPHFKKLNSFAKKIFEHCPLLGAYKMQYEELFADFSKYKSVIPSYGKLPYLYIILHAISISSAFVSKFIQILTIFLSLTAIN